MTEAYLKGLADVLPVGVAVLNRDRRVILWNRELARLTGIGAAVVAGCSWSEVAARLLVTEDGGLENLIAMVEDEGDDFRGAGTPLLLASETEGLVSVRVRFHWLGPTASVECPADDGDIPALAGIFVPVAEASAADGFLPAEHHDPTGIPSRYELSFMLPRQLALLSRYNIPFSLLFLELDSYQDLVVDLGLDVWQETLRAIYASLASVVRRADSVGGYDHATFWLLLANAGIEGSRIVAEKMLQHAAGIKVENGDVALNAVVGGAVANPRESPEALVQRALRALESARRAPGRTHVEPPAE